MKMRYKQPGTKLQLLSCYKPTNGTMFPDDGNDVDIEVNTYIDKECGSGPMSYCTKIALAYFSVKWFLDDNFKNINCIRLNGFWKVNGIYRGDEINNVEYWVPIYSVSLKSDKLNNSPSVLNSEVETGNNKAVKITTEVNAVVIKGANPGEKIKIYTTSGAEIKSIVSINGKDKITLPKNHIYFVHIGQSRYKIAL